MTYGLLPMADLGRLSYVHIVLKLFEYRWPMNVSPNVMEPVNGNGMNRLNRIEYCVLRYGMVAIWSKEVSLGLLA